MDTIGFILVFAGLIAVISLLIVQLFINCGIIAGIFALGIISMILGAIILSWDNW